MTKNHFGKKRIGAVSLRTVFWMSMDFQQQKSTMMGPGWFAGPLLRFPKTINQYQLVLWNLPRPSNQTFHKHTCVDPQLPFKMVWKSLENTYVACFYRVQVPTLGYLPFGYHLQIWIAMNGHVYDMTKFHRIHPGGSQIILQHAGTASWW